MTRTRWIRVTAQVLLITCPVALITGCTTWKPTVEPVMDLLEEHCPQRMRLERTDEGPQGQTVTARLELTAVQAAGDTLYGQDAMWIDLATPDTRPTRTPALAPYALGDYDRVSVRQSNSNTTIAILVGCMMVVGLAAVVALTFDVPSLGLSLEGDQCLAGGICP